MVTLTDQLGRAVTLINKPHRIISVVPSQTELLYSLGLDAEVAAITKFCIHPVDQVKHKLKIGGTKQLDLPLIRSLNPDLIIANKEENDRTQLEELMAAYPTYVSDPYNLPTALQMIKDVGVLVDRSELALRLAAGIKNKFNTITPLQTKLKIAYFIWRNPYMVAGQQTFIDDMLQRCGFVNAFANKRYPQITTDQLIKANPDVLLLSSEPYPFKQKHVDELALLLPGIPIKLVDGEMFSWHGSRMLTAPEYFIKLIDSLNHL